MPNTSSLPPAGAEHAALGLTISDLRAAAPLLGAMFIAFAAQISVPIPPDWVPFTFGDLAVIVTALGLGPRRGMLALVIYILAGLIGAPIFAQGGKGPAHFLGQTGGYILGYLLCQPVVGRIVRRADGTYRGWLGLVLAVLASQAIIFGVGVPGFGIVNGYGLHRTLEGGLYPFAAFIPVKAAIAVILGRIAVPWAMKRVW